MYIPIPSCYNDWWLLLIILIPSANIHDKHLTLIYIVFKAAQSGIYDFNINSIYTSCLLLILKYSQQDVCSQQFYLFRR